MSDILLGTDLEGLPVETRIFAERVCEFGLSRIQVHGIFVLLGLHVGTPRPESELVNIIKTMEIVVPHDRSINLDEVVGEFYGGYDSILDEFYFRSGATIELREMHVREGTVPHTIFRALDNGLLDPSISAINTLSDSSRMMWSLIKALGQDTASWNKSLLDAYLCGVFQMQLKATSDISGAMQFHSVLTSRLPLVLGVIFKSLSTNSFERFYGHLPLQVPLYNLMSGISEEYGRQMWGFQSHIFFYEQKERVGLDATSPQEWYSWVLDCAKDFDDAYPEQLLPFSHSGVTLSPIPIWGEAVENQTSVDKFISEIWDYKSDDLRNFIEVMEYKACLIHVVYSSLTQSRETVH